MKTAFPQTQNPVSIRLYSNIPFDNTYEHHSLISSKFKYNNSTIYSGSTTACERFLDRKRNTTGNPYYYPRYDMTDTFNFDFQNGLVGSVVLPLTPEQTNANYMRVTCGTDVYYYFITGIKQVNFETYTLSLELDALMTYQDEFLDGMQDIPVMTDRKHCHRYTNNGLMPHCADLKSGDSVFAGVKPTYIKEVTSTHFKASNMKLLEGVLWLYICVDQTAETLDDEYNISYSFKGVNHPLGMLCYPLNKKINITYNSGGTGIYTSGGENVNVMKLLVNDGKVHGCKLSPYPPFSLKDFTCTATSTTINIDVPNAKISSVGGGGYNTLYTIKDEKATFKIRSGGDYAPFIIVTDENYSLIDLDSVTLPNIKNSLAPTILSNRYIDPKLLFEPFRKYLISSPYGNSEFYPELLYSKGVYANATLTGLYTNASSYIGDNTIYTWLTDTNLPYQNYENIGLSSLTNYVVPAGTNALEVFNSTQAQAFYQSKTASGVTSGLTIAGGIGSIAVGAVLTATGYGSGAGVGMIVGGAGALAGGVASAVNTIKSTNAKVEDLKNTPDSVNVAGSSFTSDYGRTSTLYPYIITYEVSIDVKEKANDFLYNYGYQVARDCYFNIELKYNNDANSIIDNNIFGRTLFNYVKLNEDITNKINANIPIVVKQKLSQVFNKGITLWSFFGVDAIWNNNALTLLNDPEQWFMKHTYDNTEYQG